MMLAGTSVSEDDGDKAGIQQQMYYLLWRSAGWCSSEALALQEKAFYVIYPDNWTVYAGFVIAVG